MKTSKNFKTAIELIIIIVLATLIAIIVLGVNFYTTLYTTLPFLVGGFVAITLHNNKN